MLRVEVVELVEDGAHIRHFAAFGVELARHEGLCHEEQRSKAQ